MSLFGFADINFNKSNSPVNGPLRALEGSQFAGSTLRYPLDIGNYDKGHYVVFYIREQINSAFAQNAGISDKEIAGPSLNGGKIFENVPLVNNAVSNFGSTVLNTLNNGLNKINSSVGGNLSGVTRTVQSAAGGFVSGLNNVFGQKPSIVSGDAASTQSILSNNIRRITNNRFINTTQLTKDAIALYMPETLAFSQSQRYDNATPGKELIRQLAAAGVSAAQAFKDKGFLEAAGSAGSSLLKSAVLFAGDKAKGLLGESTGATAMAAAGVAVNPMLELIYSSPTFRTFQFDFMFYPRDEKEALEVQKIIEKLRFHSSPEIIKDAQGFLVPPSQFDVRFYYGGAINPNIPEIATCVLMNIDVNYAPNGWSAYEIPGQSAPSLGGTGMPVAIQLSMQFQEVEILTKEDYNTFGGSVGPSATFPQMGSSLLQSVTNFANRR